MSILSSHANKSVEILEKRLLFDGDVAVAFAGGTMTITGDSDDNQIVVTSPASGIVRITGAEDTAVNGAAFVEFAGPIDNLMVAMDQGGEDSVALQGELVIENDVIARLDEGEFIVEGSLGPIEIGGHLDARVSAEEGLIAIRNDVIVAGDARLRSGGGVAIAATRGIIPDASAASFSNSLNIDNPLFPLIPGTTYTIEEESIDDETGEIERETVVVEVTNDVKVIDGVETRVVRDRVYNEDGLVVEDTFDWFAQDDNGNVWYFGEATIAFEYDDDGNLIDETPEGSFEAGVDGARAGIQMLANPQVGDAYYQEVLPGEAVDQGTVLATDDSVTLNGLGTLTNLLRTRDTLVLEPEAVEHKLYAPGIGFIQETKFDILTGEVVGEGTLVSVTQNGVPVTQVVPLNGFAGVNATGTAPGLVEIHGETHIRSNDEFYLLDANFGGDVKIRGKAGGALVRSTFADELFIRPAGDLALRDITVEGDVYIGGDGDLYLVDSVFNDDVDIRSGWGDTNLLVQDSSFAKSFRADGSRGENLFQDLGDNDFELFRLDRFDEA